LRNAAGELHDVDAAGDLALCVGEDLAVLGGDEVGQFVAVLVEQFQELEHDARAADRRGVGPGREGGLRGRDRGVHVGLGAEGHLAGDAAAGGVGHVLGAAGGVGRGAAADVVFDICNAHGDGSSRMPGSVAKSKATSQ
jgi:hypothetical protein